MLLAANCTDVASRLGRGSAATGLTPFVVAAGRRTLEGLALQQIGKALEGHLTGHSRAGGVAALLALGVLAVPSVARADAIDLWWLMTRASGWDESPAAATVVAVGLMGVNYALNLIVLGLPAQRSIASAGRSTRVEVALLSLAAQLVDRVGCVAGFILGLLGASLFVTGEQGLVAGLVAGLALNFMFSGLGLFALGAVPRNSRIISI